MQILATAHSLFTLFGIFFGIFGIFWNFWNGKKPVTTADFLIEDPFAGFSGEDKLKAHPRKFQKKFQKIPKKILVQNVAR